MRLSCLVTDFPAVRELDVNPLYVKEKGAMALDARIIFEHPEEKIVSGPRGHVKD
jgi:acetyltransferase